MVAVETIRAAHSRAKVTSTYRFYLSSLARCAAVFAALIGQHWHIENKLHWSLDVTPQALTLSRATVSRVPVASA